MFQQIIANLNGLESIFEHSLLAQLSKVDLSSVQITVADPRGPPTDQNFLNFVQFFRKIEQICMLAPPPGGLTPPPMGNPGSAPESDKIDETERRTC